MKDIESRLLDLARIAFSGDDDAISALDALDLDDPHQRRFGDYELLERIGRGGMGVVFRARQHSLQREVALKVIAGSSQDAVPVARLVAEARMAAQLHHPNIVPVYEIGVVDDVHFFTMPLLRGATLAERLDGRALGEAEAIDLTLTLARAVAYAQGCDVLHLDLKPANVLLDDAGRPLIGDFGLARALDAATIADSAGTPAYMAPEQIDARFGAVSPRSDQYALGAMLHEFLTGLPPHGAGSAAEQLARAVSEMPAGPRAQRADIGVDIDAICRRCLQRDPALRYPNIDALVSDLARCRDGNEVSVRPRHWPERLARGMRRHPGASLAAAIAVAALLGGLFGITREWRRAEEALRIAQHERETSAARAERLRQLAGLLAASFPTTDADDALRRRSARDAVAWLTREAGTDGEAQRELLDAFGSALRASGKGDAVTLLLDEILRQRGTAYQRERLSALLARDDRDSLIALQLVVGENTDGEARTLAAEGARRLVQRYAADADARYALALGCSLQSIACDNDTFARLTELAPDNAVHWILALPDAPEAQTRAQLHRAAQAPTFDDHLASSAALLRRTLPPAAPPDDLRAPLRGVLDDAEIAPSLLRREVDAVALPRYITVVRLCRPDQAPATTDAALRADCSAFAHRALESPQASILSRMIAVTMLRRLHRGEAIAQRALDYRRQYVWLSEQFTEHPIDAEQLQQDLARHGEWEAWLRAADRAGIARTPAVDWKPRNAQTLLLPEERSRTP